MWLNVKKLYAVGLEIARDTLSSLVQRCLTRERNRFEANCAN